MLEEMLKTLRGLDWRVAVHNDYRLNGEDYTFWLFTHFSGEWLKGEGRTDIEALKQVLLELQVRSMATDVYGKVAKVIERIAHENE